MPLEYANQTEVSEVGLVHARWIRAEESAPLVVMIHGRAGKAAVISAFAGSMPERTNLFAPQAGIPDLDGFSWWPIEQRFDVSLAVAAAEKVYTAVNAACHNYGINPRAFYLLGFSQGGALAATLFQLYPHVFSGLALLAGFVPRVLEQKVLSPHSRRVLIAHGLEDEVIPVKHAHEAASFLEASGAEVLLHLDPVGHKLGTAGMRQLKTWALQNFA
jgi:phospholipase/carboxylesterase